MIFPLSPDLFFTSPNNEDTLYYDTQVKLSWENKKNQNVKLLFSIDRGKTWNLLGRDLSVNEILWNVPKFQSDKIMLRLVTIDNEDVELIRKIENAHSNEIRCLDISDDGKYLLSSSRDSKIKIWSLAKNEVVDSLTFFTSENFFNAYFYNNYIVATLDSTLLLWNRESGKAEVAKNLINNAIRSCAVNQKEKVIAAGSFDGRIFIIKEDFQGSVSSMILPDSAIVLFINFFK
jgi:WD40 repeat protein